MQDAKSVWVILLALLFVTLVWFWATGRGQAFVTSFQTALGQQPSTPAVSASSTSQSALPLSANPAQYVPVSATQSLPVGIPALTTAQLVQQIQQLANPTAFAPSTAYGSIPTYISTMATPAYTNGLNLGTSVFGSSGVAGGTGSPTPAGPNIGSTAADTGLVYA